MVAHGSPKPLVRVQILVALPNSISMSQVRTKAIKPNHLVKHETKRLMLTRFLLLIAILVAYMTFMGLEFGVKKGGIITVLTWSFFVLCTPIADGGFLIAFPIRILFKIKMAITEIFVTFVAIGISVTTLIVRPELYDDHILLIKLFKKILTTPYPYWGIILLSAVGTFLSVVFGDELLDVIKHRHRKIHHKHSWKLEMIFIAFAFLFVWLSYGFLLEHLGIDISK